MSLVALQDQQFEIGDTRFGGTLDLVKLDSLDVGSASFDVQDQDNPFGPTTYFGRDTLRGPEWTFEMVTDGGVAGTIADARRAAEALALEWRSPYHHDENRLQVLRYSLGGRTRRVYGRGRKFDMDVVPLSFSGTAPISATFKLAENIYYDDFAQSISIPIVAPTQAGLIAPLKAPLTTAGQTQFAQRGIEIGGTVPTPVTVTFQGPVLRPWVRSGNFFIQYDYGLAADQLLTVTGFNELKAIDNFGRNLTGKMSHRTRMSNVRIGPGMQYFTFGGTDDTGSASATISWRNAYTML